VVKKEMDKMTRKNLLFAILLPVLLFGKSYFYPQIKTDIYFTSDGNARVRQERTYQFDGSYSWAFVDLKKQGANDIVLNQVAEQTDTGWAVLEPEVTDNSKSLYIKWAYSAQDESKTFLLDYTITGAVKRYQDVAEFYWKAIEDQHEQIANNTIELFLPDTSPGLFKVYIHSQTRPGTLYFNDRKDNAVIRQDNIPENSFVEVRMLTSPLIFSNVEIISEKQYEKILQQEKRNFLVSSIKKFIFIPLGLLLVIIVPIILFIIFYFRYGREPDIPYIGMYEHEPPRKAPPITLPAILHQKPEKTTINQSIFQAMFAGLLDLCTKGIISVQEVKDKKSHYQFTLEKPDKVRELEPINQEIVKFFFEEVGNSRVIVTDKDLKDYAIKHSTTLQAFLQNLFNQGREWWGKTLGIKLLDQDSQAAYNKYILFILCSILIGDILLGIGLTALFGIEQPPAFIIPIISGIFIFIIFVFVGRSILRWSAPAYQEQKRWQNFRRFLSDFSAIQQAPITLLPIWEHYFVYAVVLGVAQKFLKNITNLAMEQNTALIMPIWFVSASGPKSINTFAESMSSFESFTSNFTGMMNSFSSSVATGGGFSGGGGGGGGGGSSGAG
jgi:uncharacterized membrane protein